jgi:hypothetical protein
MGRADGVQHMGDIQYAVRVRGRPYDAMLAASLEGLDFAMDPARTVLRGRLPDQAALLGVLVKARLLGLELIEVRRIPQAAGR